MTAAKPSKAWGCRSETLKPPPPDLRDSARAMDYDEKTKVRTPAADKVTGQRVWQCRVMDMDPELEGRSRETVVKIIADREPTPPTRAAFELVLLKAIGLLPDLDRYRWLVFTSALAAVSFTRHRLLVLSSATGTSREQALRLARCCLLDDVLILTQCSPPRGIALRMWG